ncbi:unnamed protein product [Psylliodes chrysocephalus]|uniref:Odorant receptor n=1 Tax=Psylliodes chrysocephalus TaxID=3402493 RepID=A0A9P0CRS9_9CUCU|nr:unnamed protein product [Psylliodes chrysocephala]
MQLYFTCFIVCLVIGLSDAIQLVEKIDALGIILFCVVMFIKIIICQRENIAQILTHIVKYDENLDKLDKENLKIYYSIVRYNTIFCLTLFFFSGMCGVTVVFCKLVVYKHSSNQATLGLINDTEILKPLPYYIWRPIDYKEHYFAAFILDIVTASIGCTYNTSTQIVYLTLLTFIIGQLKILQVNFRNYGFVCSQKSTDKEKFYYLRNLIIEHQRIISFVKELDDNMKYLLFLEFTINPIQITSSLYEILVFKLDTMLPFRITLLFCMMLQIFVLTWHANQIQIYSMGVSQAVYDSEWYDLPQRIKHHLLIILMRAQKPLTLSVGPFFVLTNSAAVTVSIYYNCFYIIYNIMGHVQKF